ncbi:MAG TPA: pitrilysin family protein [Anaerolineales bacterium]|nr:pitrilysin family protein [Anaerolineales bacterium]
MLSGLIKHLNAITRICALVMALVPCSQLMAGEYTPPGLYDVKYYQLPNGLRVLLKERHQARSVSYRVVVNVGQADYPCGRKETPHFLEHLLFTGTSAYTESELDDLVEEHGGSWNAYTREESTDYVLDIFSLYAPLGLETLHDIITDSQITQENVNRSRDIIHREAGGRPSFVESWYRELGMGRSGSGLAHDKLVEGTSYACSEIDTADDISRSDILKAYERYYVASNMTLVVVGDFDPEVMKAQIESTFGSIQSGEHNHRQLQDPMPVSDALTLTSTLSPLIDSEALVGVAYASGGSRSPDYYPRWVIEKYLSDRLFKKLRLEEGLSYSASVDTSSYSNVDVWYIYADTELDTIDEVIALIRQEIDQLVREPIGDEAMSLVKSKLLMSIAKGFESNSGMADYYAASLHEIEKRGSLVREEEEIEALTSEDIQRVAQKIFSGKPPVVFQDKPTITYDHLAVGLGMLALLIAFLVFRYMSRKRILKAQGRNILD